MSHHISSRHRLRRGTITITQEHQPAGVVVYRLSGPRLSGAVTVEPWVTGHQAIPDRWAVNLGTGSMLAAHRRDLPVIDGVTIYGGGGPLLLSDSGFWSRMRLQSEPGHGDVHSCAQLTDAKRYLFAVLKQIGDLHCRHDLQQMLLAGARHSAMRRLPRCGHDVIATYQVYAETRHELAAATVLAQQLQELSPLPVISPARRRAGWHGCVDPDVYLHADDDGDWLTCPCCDQRITRLDGGDRLGSLLNEAARHQCP